ncbi:amidohydrolase family protein [Granulicoccus phenolivorans]|uniref:amidohydrolase family protein n=1 Tax=Granulicoccus phenolivorans TaxID=266854 RepID=UPI0004054EBF|nr:amidohydrolase family protein [Granulicoccus phenolivorans]
MRAWRAAHAFDGERFFTGGVTVLMEDDTIVAVESEAFEVPADCEVTTYAGTLLPGLIDCHVHLVFDGSPNGLELTGSLTDDELDTRIETALAAQVAAGVTTVRDLGDVRYRTVVARDRARPGLPRILAAGPPLTTPGGHCHFLGGVIDADHPAERAIAEHAEHGVDVIKVMASGGILTPDSDQFGAQFATTELRTLVDLAHARGLKLRTHAHSLLGMERAVAAGVDGIEHFSGLRPGGSVFPEALLAATAAANISVCPTLGTDRSRMPPGMALPPGFVKVFGELGLPTEPAGAALFDRFLELRQAAVRLAYAAGIRIVSGSDAGVGPPKPHGCLQLAVQELASAIPFADALASATSWAADDCGVPAGRLRPGLSADLLVVDGDLRTDPTALGRPTAVLVRGRPADQ